MGPGRFSNIIFLYFPNKNRFSRLGIRCCNQMGPAFWISPNGEAISMRRFRKYVEYVLNYFEREPSHTYRFPIWGNPKRWSQTFATAYSKPEKQRFSVKFKK